MTIENYRLYENLYLADAVKRYGVDPDSVKHLGGFENLVYSARRDGRELILRVTPGSQRTPDYMAVELDWMLRLADHGVQVTSPVASHGGSLMERAETDGASFLMSVFEKAQGEHVGAGHPQWGPVLFEQWGQLTGQMHRYSENYRPPEGMPRRIGLALDPVYEGDASGEEESERERKLDQAKREGTAAVGPEFIKRELERSYTRISAEAERLPKDGSSYGICHRDLHHGNFFVDEAGRMTAFDFDDCGDDYYLQDIAMPVYYASVFADWYNPETDPNRVTDFADRFLHDFLKGYERERRIEAGWLKQLPIFIEKRRVDLCLMQYDIWGAADATPRQREWVTSSSSAILYDIPCMSLRL